MLALLLWVGVAIAAPPFLSNVFGDHMVLQRDRPARLFGFATPGLDVTTQMKSTTGFQTTLKTTADSSGVWRQALPTQPGSDTPFSFTISAAGGLSATLNDVLFGDVHICSGQSNMQFTVVSAINATQEVADASKYPLIRVFTVGQSTSSPTPLQFLHTIEQPWAIASSASVGGQPWAYFSAVCWFTYRDVFNALGGKVPMGLISDNWGGTPIEHWSSPDALSTCQATTDSVLWNAMVVPYTVGPMALRTVIWYQGEANVGQAALYDCRARAMISDWRMKFQTDFTFGLVQIAACDCYKDNDATGDLRQAQTSPLYSMQNIAVATAVDLVDVPGGSSPQDIHPPAKQPVGSRLSNQILAREYGIGDATLPLYDSVTTATSGTSVMVKVNLVGCVDQCELRPVTCPKSVNETHCEGFQIQVNNRDWLPATATMIGASTVQLVAQAPGLGFSAIATSYGRALWPLVSLYSKSSSLPVLPWCNTLAGKPCYSV